jgi:4,5-DOPA dioxygenase extradiol
MPRPKAILCISAHWETEHPSVTHSAKPQTIYDFFGFPDELYRIQYPAQRIHNSFADRVLSMAAYAWESWQ